MLYCDHWEDLKRRMTGYWEREAMNRCCAALVVGKPGCKEVHTCNYYFDVETADRMMRRKFESCEYIGESLPVLFPYFGTAGIAEYTGCKPERTPRTTWYEPWLTEDEPDASRIGFNCPEAFDRQKDAIARMLELSKGEYLVSVTDNCGIVDALAAIRGNESFLMDMLTDPLFVEEGVRRLMPVYKETQEQLFDLVRENNDGSVLSWMHLWAPKRMAQMQCDLSVMISSEVFNRFVMPELEEMCDFLDYPVYHFDGQEQIRHLDALLSLKKLRAIQWTPVEGQPRTSSFIPVLQRIQKAGKNLVLMVSKEEVPVLLDNLNCRGLHMIVSGAQDPAEARDLMRLIEMKSKDRAL